jgi:hypothetical protein
MQSVRQTRCWVAQLTQSPLRREAREMLAFKLALAVSVQQTPAHSPPRSLAIWLRQTHPPLAQVDRRRLLHRPRSAALTRCRRGHGPSWGRERLRSSRRRFHSRAIAAGRSFSVVNTVAFVPLTLAFGMREAGYGGSGSALTSAKCDIHIQ